MARALRLGAAALMAAVLFALLAFLLIGPPTEVRAQSYGGGAYPLRASGLTTTVVTVKGSPGTLGWLQCLNPNAATSEYVQVFDVAPGTTVTLGTTVPKLAFGFAGGQSLAIPIAGNFTKGIKIAATTTAAGNTAPAVALDCNVGFY